MRTPEERRVEALAREIRRHMPCTLREAREQARQEVYRQGPRPPRARWLPEEGPSA